MADDIDKRAAVLGRLLTLFQVNIGQELPPVVLLAQVRAIHRVSGELEALLERAEPGTVVHVDPTLGPNVAGLLGEYLDGPPDHIPDEWQ